METESDGGEAGRTENDMGSEEAEMATRYKKKVKTKANSDKIEPEKEETSPQEFSFEDKLLGGNIVKVSKDSKGRGILDEARSEYLSSLQDLFVKNVDEDTNQNNSESPEDEDEDCPTLRVPREEYEFWCAPWRKSLIVKLLGKTLDVGRRGAIWNICGRRRRPLLHGIWTRFSVISFEDKEDINQIYQDGPWMITDR